MKKFENNSDSDKSTSEFSELNKQRRIGLKLFLTEIDQEVARAQSLETELTAEEKP